MSKPHAERASWADCQPGWRQYRCLIGLSGRGLRLCGRNARRPRSRPSPLPRCKGWLTKVIRVVNGDRIGVSEPIVDRSSVLDGLSARGRWHPPCSHRRLDWQNTSRSASASRESASCIRRARSSWSIRRLGAAPESTSPSMWYARLQRSGCGGARSWIPLPRALQVRRERCRGCG